jgi:serine/threonine protein kinase
VATDSFGHYQLLDVLGRGGMGQVFRSYDTATNRVVALKLLPPHLAEDREFQERFRREARIAASLNDPHIVPIHSYGEIDGRLYVDMRLIEGRDLVKYIAENGGRLSAARAVAVIDQVATALDSAHNAGLIHRDIKPSNILVATARDFVYLIDFGIARGTNDTALTNTGHTMGTMAYMAPERLRGTTDLRADVYSLACVLYECLTGRRPFPGDSLEEQLSGHLETPPPRPSATASDIPPAFDEVIARGMAKDPQARYQTAIELADAAKAAGPIDVPTPPSPPSPPRVLKHPQAQTSTKRLIWGVVAGSVISLAAVTALVLTLVTHSQHSAKSAPSQTPIRARVPRSMASGGTNALAMPAFAPQADLGSNCQYPPSTEPASKPVKPPQSGKVSTDPAGINASIATNQGDIGLQLANDESPCTVNSFTSLAQQGFFDGTSCPRLTTSPTLGVLQCGDPKGDGTGGPGYQFADEYPTDQYPPNDPQAQQSVLYPRGTLAMANAGPNTNGSQFILVYNDSELAPEYTVFGTIDDAGLATIDKVAKEGIAGGGDDGTPAATVTINSVRVD